MIILSRNVDLEFQESPRAENRPDPGSLTTRERQVLSLLGQGKTTDDIARDLGVTRVTVRNYIQRIHQKLGVHQRIQAVLYALQHGLVERPVL